MSVAPGKYRHYKGGEYEVLGVGRIEATLEECVVYRSLYAANDFPAGSMWVRPMKSFLETIRWNDIVVPRFTYVGPSLT